jgi:hypothetical protein
MADDGAGKALRVAFTVDVEEEGLFSGAYPRAGSPVTNVRNLERVEFVTRDFGLPLTLLATYPVLTDPCGLDVLGRWQERLGAEIGVHLHPWNTPPFRRADGDEPVRTRNFTPEQLRAKLETLCDLAEKALGRRPRSLRMGRFDFHEGLSPIVASAGLRVDSSVVPLRYVAGGPDHFLAPRDPYCLPGATPGDAGLTEVPLTMEPLIAAAPPFVHAIATRLGSSLGERLLSTFRRVGAAGPHPAWFPLASMRAATWLHGRRGGRVLTVFLHSSELAPGVTPNYPNETSVNRLARKIRRFLHALSASGPLAGCTLSGLGAPGTAPANR